MSDFKRFVSWLRDVRMCYSSGQTGIIQRMLREEGGWQGHLANTSKYILDAVELHKPRTIRILGSGWLLDVPIRELLESCEKVVLVDIIHPRQIINKFSKYNNIIFERKDITGGVADIVYNIRSKGFNYDRFIDEVRSIQLPEYNEDLVVSVNLMSQLSVFISDYLFDKFHLTHDQLVEFSSLVQLNHLKSLPLGRTVLSTDYEEVFLDEDDKLVGTNPTVFIELPKNHTSKEWDWLFDFKMTYKEDRKTLLKMVAVRL